jgi:hypothetical protein
MTSDSPTIEYGVPTVDRLPKPPDDYVPGFFAPTNLPEELAQSQDVLAFLRLGVTQWSRIAAWTWCDYRAFDGTNLEKKEIKLKQDLIKFLTQQSSNTDGYLNYGDLQSPPIADSNSQEIVKQLLANDNLKYWYNDDNTPITDWNNLRTDKIYLDEKHVIALTLSDILIKTTGTPLVTSVPENKAFVKLFYVQITRDSFTGRIVRASADLKKPKEKYIENWNAKYINIIAYPPRPETFIDLREGNQNYDLYKDRDSLLKAWASGCENPENPYLPPSAYIPIATT